VVVVAGGRAPRAAAPQAPWRRVTNVYNDRGILPRSSTPRYMDSRC